MIKRAHYWLIDPLKLIGIGAAEAAQAIGTIRADELRMGDVFRVTLQRAGEYEQVESTTCLLTVLRLMRYRPLPPEEPVITVLADTGTVEPGAIPGNTTMRQSIPASHELELVERERVLGDVSWGEGHHRNRLTIAKRFGRSLLRFEGVFWNDPLEYLFDTIDDLDAMLEDGSRVPEDVRADLRRQYLSASSEV